MTDDKTTPRLRLHRTTCLLCDAVNLWLGYREPRTPMERAHNRNANQCTECESTEVITVCRDSLVTE